MENGYETTVKENHNLKYVYIVVNSSLYQFTSELTEISFEVDRNSVYNSILTGIRISGFFQGKLSREDIRSIEEGSFDIIIKVGEETMYINGPFVFKDMKYKVVYQDNIEYSVVVLNCSPKVSPEKLHSIEFVL